MDQRHAQEKAAQDLLASLSNSENRNRFTDYSIKLDERIWRVHRIIISIHSPVLAEACAAPVEEERSRAFTINAADNDCVQALVNYFYDLNYAELDPTTSAGNPMSFHIKVATVAKLLDMPNLINLASAKFEASLNEQLNRKEGPDRARMAYACLLATDCREYGAEKIYQSAVKFLADNTQLLEIEAPPAERNPIVVVLRTIKELGKDVVTETQRRTNRAKLAALTAGHRNPR